MLERFSLSLCLSQPVLGLLQGVAITVSCLQITPDKNIDNYYNNLFILYESARKYE